MLLMEVLTPEQIKYFQDKCLPILAMVGNTESKK